MTYRKTWFSCVLWILYTILCVILLTVLAGGVWTAYLAGIPYGKGFPLPVFAPLKGMSDGILTLLGFIILPVTVLLYLTVRKVSGVIRKKCTWKEHALLVWECAAVLLILAGGVFLRIMYMQYAVSMAEHEQFLAEQVSGMDYYYMALSPEGNAAVPLNRIAYLYVFCLSVVLSFLGHKIASAIVLQMILQIAGMLLAYVVTRKIAGRLPACIVLLYLSCSYCCLRMLICFSPEWLFFVLYMLGMLLAAGFIQSYCDSRLSKLSALFGAAAVGAVIGMLVWIEPAAAPLMLMFAVVAIGRKKRQESMPVYHSARTNAAVIAVAVITYAVMQLSAVWFASSGVQFDPGKIELWYSYSDGFINMKPYVYDAYAVGLLLIPASFLIFEFFRSGKEQNYTWWILLCIVVAPTPMAVIGRDKFGLLSLYIWAVLAGLGLQNCIFGGKAKVMQAVIEQINAEADLEEPEAAEQPQKPRFIENPLPLPKKHVKKDMDYQYPVEEKDMKYDIEVSEHDDFDIS